MSMTIKEIDNLFATDNDDRFINLIIPKDKLGEELNLIGKKRMDLSLDEIIRVKKYASLLYEEALGTYQ